MANVTTAQLNALRADAVNLAAERSRHGHPLPDSEIRAAWAGVDAVLAAGTKAWHLDDLAEPTAEEVRAVEQALYVATADPHDFEVPAVARRLAEAGVRAPAN